MTILQSTPLSNKTSPRSIFLKRHHTKPSAKKRNVLKCYNGCRRRNCCNILFQPFQLDRVDAPIIPEIFELDTVESDKMDASIIEGIIIRPQVMMIHFSSIKWILLTHELNMA